MFLSGLLSQFHILQWILFIALVLLIWRTLVLIRSALAFRLPKFTWLGTRATSYGVELLHKTKSILLFIIAIAITAKIVGFPDSPRAEQTKSQILLTAVLIQIGIWANALLSTSLNTILTREGSDPARRTSLGLLLFMSQAAVWIIVVLMALDNFGVNVTTFIAGLGIGGVAVALALQNILGDVFASLSIVLDKPFELGDFIVIGDVMGTVERIGIKTTRIRSLSGEQIVLSNSDLLASRIRNFKRMFTRRVEFVIEVERDTTPEQLRMIPSILRNAIEGRELVQFDRAHLKEISQSAFRYESVYIFQNADFNKYMDVQQDILLQIVEKFRQERIGFALPAQNILFHQDVPAHSDQASTGQPSAIAHFR